MQLCTIILQDHELVVEVQTSADAGGANVLTLDWYVLFGIDVEHIWRHRYSFYMNACRCPRVICYEKDLGRNLESILSKSFVPSSVLEMFGE